MEKIRTFIAVPIPTDILNIIADVQSKFKAKWPKEVKWVDIPLIHITIQFLGNIDSDQVSNIVQTMNTALAKQTPFEVSLQNVGVFPNLQRPRVIWIGITDPQQQLLAMNHQVSEAMKAYGIEPEEHFSPHLTLGRARENSRLNGLSTALEEIPSSVLATMKVDRVILFQSTLQRSGAIYKPLSEMTLTGQA